MMCTTLIAGTKATEDGVMLVARNEDNEKNNWNKYVFGMRKPQYDTLAPDEKWTLGNGLTVPVPREKIRYCSIADEENIFEAIAPAGDHYFFEERGINEQNVAMSATNSMGINKKALAADPTVPSGIEESIMLTLILPQIESAVDGVKLLGKYVEEYGASEANGIAFADENEAWYMEIGSGHQWIAVRVPDDKYLLVANCMRIRCVNLEDDSNIKYSAGLFEFVEKFELLDSPERANFDFASAFGYFEKMNDPTDLYYNVDRLWLGQKILNPSTCQPARQKTYPLFLTPENPLTIENVAEVLRAGYSGTELDGEATRPIGVVRTAESHIMVLDPSMPDPLKGMIWQTMATPLACPYMPLFAMTDEIPDIYAKGNSKYDETSAYWRFRGLFALASRVGRENEITNEWIKYEKLLMRKHQNMAEFLKSNGDIRLASEYSKSILLRAADKASKMTRELLTRIAMKQTDAP
ncbi:MAG: C69 family dipeptidase [Treponema sp.]|jgi:dipeptidase|nr:C69 family dipeptidase [Treponema sp.]